MPSPYQIARMATLLSVLSSALAHSHAIFHSNSALRRRQYETMTEVGCFSSSNPLVENSTYQYQSTGHCQEACVGDNNAPVLGLTNGNDCWCGSLLPSASDKVDDSNCDSPCTGYGQVNCGGNGYWSVYLTGTETNVANVDSSSSSSSSSSSAASSAASTSSTQAAATQAASKGTTTTAVAPSVVTSIAPGKTVVVTESPAVAATTAVQSSTTAKSSSGPNVAGIAAGVVVGVVAVAGICAGVYFFIRHKKRQEAEQAYKKNQVAGFMANGGKVPAMRRPAGPDSRIDHEAMAQRRMSDGSIADNEDFSRRILKVTNPDGT